MQEHPHIHNDLAGRFNGLLKLRLSMCLEFAGLLQEHHHVSGNAALTMLVPWSISLLSAVIPSANGISPHHLHHAR
jgi:hypothetical protein